MPSAAAKWRSAVSRASKKRSAQRTRVSRDTASDTVAHPRTGYPLGGGSNAVAGSFSIGRNTTSQGRNFPGAHES